MPEKSHNFGNLGIIFV